MPGIFCHIAFAEKMYGKLSKYKSLSKTEFISGNLIPDLSQVDKSLSHYRKDASISGLFVPNMEQVREQLFNPNDSIKLGLFCHLYLDYHFIEEYLISGFIWDSSRMKIVHPTNGLEWDPEPFFKKEGVYYEAFNEINDLLIKDGYVSMDTISELPEILPDTGIDIFDIRCERTWKKEIEEYIFKKKPYTGNVFNYENLVAFMEKISIQLTEEIKRM